MPGLLGGTLSAIPSLFSLANGIGNVIKGHQMNPVRPTYQIPDEVKQELGLRQNLLNAEMPGEQQAEQNIYGAQANATSGLFRAANDQGQLLSGLGAIYAGTNNAMNNLESERERNYSSNLAGLENAQNNMAAYKDKAFEINKMDPYMMDMERKYQLENAGNQDIMGGLNGISSLAASLLGLGNKTKPLSGQFGLSTPSPFANLGPATLAPGGANLAAMASGYPLSGLLRGLPEVASLFATP